MSCPASILLSRVAMLEKVVATRGDADLLPRLVGMKAEIKAMAARNEARLADVKARNDGAQATLLRLSAKFAESHEGYGRLEERGSRSRSRSPSCGSEQSEQSSPTIR